MMENENLQSFEEKKTELADLLVKTQGFDKTAALKVAENMIKTTNSQTHHHTLRSELPAETSN